MPKTLYITWTEWLCLAVNLKFSLQKEIVKVSCFDTATILVVENVLQVKKLLPKQDWKRYTCRLANG